MMFKMTIRGIRGQKRISILMTAVLLLSFLFMTLTSLIASSVQHAGQLQREDLYGRYQLLYAGNLDTANALRQEFPGAEVSMLAGTTDSGQAVGSITERFQEIANLSISDGCLPQDDHEILLVGDEWNGQVGQEIPVVYTYSYARVSFDSESGQLLKTYLLEGLNQDRDNYLSQIEPYWNSYISSGEAEPDLSPEMLRPLAELSPEQQDAAFLKFAYSLPAFSISGSQSTQKSTGAYQGFTAQLEIISGSTILQGPGFGEHVGTKFEGTSFLASVKLYATYVVSGIAESYAKVWDVNGLNMPEAFLGDGGCEQIYQALAAIEAEHPEVRPQPHEAVMLFYEPQGNPADNVTPVLDAYNQKHNAAYELTGVSYEGSIMKAYLTGLDPQTGERVTFDVLGSGQSGYIRMDGQRLYFSIQELSDSDFRLGTLEPVPLEPVTLDGLYQNNTGAIRVNSLAYPPVGDPAQTMERLLSGVLIGMSACASFQLYLQSMRRRKQTINTLMAIGATDGQVVGMLLMEVSVFLAVSALLGILAGMGIARYILPHVMKIPVSVNTGNLLTGLLCSAAAILVGTMLPVGKILRECHGKKRLSKAQKLHSPRKPAKSRSGYRHVWMRHCSANPKQTLLRGAVILLMAATLLLPLFLGHRAYGDYYGTVTNPDRPDYELSLPYAASNRYLQEVCGQMELPYEKLQVYVTAENVLLHCDGLMESSPLLQALRQDPRGSDIFAELPEGGLGASVRIIGADWESELVQRMRQVLPQEISREDFSSGKVCIVLIPRFRQENGSPVPTRITASAAAELQHDRRAGALLELSYLPQFAGVYGEDTSVSGGDVLTLSGWTQTLSGGDHPRLEETLYTAQTEVAAVVHGLPEGIWPISDTDGAGGITILSDPQLAGIVYPKAFTRMSAEQVKYFRVASEMYYPDCYGKTYLQLWRPDGVEDPSAYEKQVIDFAAEFGFDVVKHVVVNQKLLFSARNSGAAYLMMGISLLLITVILLGNLLSAETEEDRKRLGILQAIGMTNGQYLGGQCVQALLSGLSALLLTHLLLLIVACAGLGTMGGGPAMLLCRLRLTLRFYPWRIHVLLCLAYLVLLQLMHLQAALPVLRKEPSENLRS